MIAIYKITSPTGRIYIGKTKDIFRRITEYKKCISTKNSISKQVKIYNSITKYGWEKHSFDVVAYCNEKHANELEIYYISYFKSFNGINKKGMNLTLGGDGGSGLKKKMSESTKLKVSLQKGNGPFDIIDYNTLEIVESNLSSLVKVANFLKISKHVSRSSYKNKTIINSVIIKHSLHKFDISLYSIKKTNERRVVKLNCENVLLDRYKSIKEASLSSLNNEKTFNPSCIRRCCAGQTKTAHGYIWMYEDDYLANNYKYTPRTKHRYKVARICKMTKNIKVYKNILEASSDNDKSVKSINDCITRGYISGNFTYEYLR